MWIVVNIALLAGRKHHTVRARPARMMGCARLNYGETI